MKSVITAGMILILIVVTVVGATVYANRLSAELLQMLDGLDGAVSREDWAEAEAAQIRIRQRWDAAEQTASMFFEHNTLQAVEGALARMDSAIAERGVIEVRMELENAAYMLEMLQKRLRCSLGNIF